MQFLMDFVKKSLHFVNECCILHIVLMKNTW